MSAGSIYGNTATEYAGGGVWITTSNTTPNRSVFNKTGGIINGYLSTDTNNSNKVDYGPNNDGLQENKGHAVYVESNTWATICHRESTADENVSLSYDGSLLTPSISGDWDKDPNSSITIIIVDMDEWVLLTSTMTVNANGPYTFVIESPYTVTQWYLNGDPVGNNTSTYTFSQPKGIYEVAVLVTKDGESRSGSCQVIVH